MSWFRKDLYEKKPTIVDVPHKKNMMCLNESYVDPFQLLKDKFLKKMENVHINRYYSSVTENLYSKLADYIGFGILPSQILMGNGADEMLYYLFTSLREDKDDFILSLSPSYFDYKSYSGAVGINIKFLSLEPNFDFNEQKFIEIAQNKNCKLAILCNPNNPTGNLLPNEKILRILEVLDKPVLIDETYYEFSGKTFAQNLSKFNNLILIRTFSKAFSGAGLRFGYMISSKENIEQIKKVFTVFNLSIFIQTFALTILENKELFLNINKEIISQREYLFNELNKIEGIQAFPSYTNFITFNAGEDYLKLFEFLSNNEIAIRNVGKHPILRHCLRVTVSSKDQNKLFLENIIKYKNETK